jgi:hypothetical protein
MMVALVDFLALLVVILGEQAVGEVLLQLEEHFRVLEMVGQEQPHLYLVHR